MAINERLVHTASATAAGTGNQEEGLILYLDANDVDSYDGDGTEWVDITNHEYTPATNVSEHFNTVLYTGNGSTNAITGVGFQPDLVWIKNRDTTNDHTLLDSIRGATKRLFSNLTNAESVSATNLTSFDSDGFTVGADASVNGNNNDIVAWCFKAGGAAVSNTDGSITSQVSANNDLGFSIVEYTGVPSGTVGHGLNVPPELIITKKPGATSYWQTYAAPLGKDKLLQLNSTSAEISVSNYWGTNPPTGSVFGLSSNGAHDPANGVNIAYCFASKRGVSKVGSYKGVDSTDVKVNTGFEPAWIMIKKTNGISSWAIYDNKRDTVDPNTNMLRADTSSTPVDAPGYYDIYFDRDGFTVGGYSGGNDTTNNSGDTYIYYAVAKDTNETSLIPDTDLELHLDADSFPEKGEAGHSNTPTTWTALTGSNGTITGATFDSELGNYLDFDGSNDKVAITATANTPIDFTAKNYTIESWINPDTSGINQIFTKYGSSDSLRSIGFFINTDNTLRLIQRTSITDNSYSTSTIPQNTWTHIAVARSSSEVKFYINGTLDNTVSNSFTPNSGENQPILIGTNGSTTPTYFNGQIGQVRAYSSALTQDQIRQNFNFTKNDYPNGFDGAISGATWNSGGYFSFDGSNDKVTLPYTDNPSNATFSAWVNCNNVSTYNNFISKGYYSGSTNTNYFYLATYATPYPEFRVRLNGTSIAATSSVAISNNTWHHLVGTVSSTGDLQIYVDGTLTGSATGAPARNMTQSIIVGAYLSGALQFFDGEMSKIKLYDKVLTSPEITALYNEGE